MPVAPGITDARRSKGGQPVLVHEQAKGGIKLRSHILPAMVTTQADLHPHSFCQMNTAKRTNGHIQKKDRGNNVENAGKSPAQDDALQKKTSILGTQNRKIGTCSFLVKFDLMFSHRTGLCFLRFQNRKVKKKGGLISYQFC